MCTSLSSLVYVDLVWSDILDQSQLGLQKWIIQKENVTLSNKTGLVTRIIWKCLIGNVQSWLASSYLSLTLNAKAVSRSMDSQMEGMWSFSTPSHPLQPPPCTHLHYHYRPCYQGPCDTWYPSDNIQTHGCLCDSRTLLRKDPLWFVVGAVDLRDHWLLRKTGPARIVENCLAV